MDTSPIEMTPKRRCCFGSGSGPPPTEDAATRQTRAWWTRALWTVAALLSAPITCQLALVPPTVTTQDQFVDEVAVQIQALFYAMVFIIFFALNLAVQSISHAWVLEVIRDDLLAHAVLVRAAPPRWTNTRPDAMICALTAVGVAACATAGESATAITLLIQLGYSLRAGYDQARVD